MHSREPTVTPVVVSWSGGKDSTLTLERLLAAPEFRVVALLTTISAQFDRVSIHGVRRSILLAQAQRLGIPLVEVPLGPSPSNDSYESAFAEQLAALRASNGSLETIAFGDLFLEDVRAYRDALVAKLGWTARYPLWGEDTEQLARYFIDRGYQATLTCVDTEQIEAAFAGRSFSTALLADLPPTCDPCGERGEFHSCVTSGPLFSAPIRVRTGERVLRDARFMFCDLIDESADETP
jgi:uncharacterized protein (TIGR00290 family)